MNTIMVTTEIFLGVDNLSTKWHDMPVNITFLMKNKVTSLASKPISFRTTIPFYDAFAARVEALGVTEGELARKSCEYGIERAVSEFIEVKRKEAESTLKALDGMSKVKKRGGNILDA